MTFKELFGSKEKIALIDFLSDHPRYWYTTEEIKERWDIKNTSPKEALTELENEKLINVSMTTKEKSIKLIQKMKLLNQC